MESGGGDYQPAVPRAMLDPMDLPSKSSKETSTQEEEGDAHGMPKQTIIEVPNGQSIDGQPQQPGPQYKRGRGRSFFKEPPRKGIACQVPNCERSLHKLRDYYKRYKICPYHLELNCMVVEGQSIRFCQQCGRFQLLDEFDGDRRSCRRKLEKHNERRRKLEGALTDSDSGGEAYARGGRPGGVKMRRSNGGGGGWGERASAAAAAMPSLGHLSLGLGPPPPGLGLGPAPPSVSDMLQMLAGDDFLMHGLGPSLASGMAGMLGGGVPALPPAGRWGVPPPGAPPQLHPGLIAALAEVTAGQSSAPPPVLTSHPAVPAAVRPAATADASMAADALQQLLREGSAAAAAPPAAPGLGPLPAAPAVKAEPIMGTSGSAFGPPAPSLSLSADKQQASGPEYGAAPFETAGPARAEPSASAPTAVPAPAATVTATVTASATTSAPMSSLSDMLGLLQKQLSEGELPGGAPAAAAPGGAPAAAAPAAPPAMGHLLSLLSQLERKPALRPPPEQDVMNLSVKLFRATPAQLPPGLLAELTTWMTKTPTYAEVATRPGCVHDDIVALVTAAEREALGDARRAAARLRLSGDAGRAALLQVPSPDGPRAALVAGGDVAMVLDLGGPSAPLPEPIALRPLAATPAYAGPFLALAGCMDPDGGDALFCRSHGGHVQVEVVERGAAVPTAAAAGGAPAAGWVKFTVPGLAEGGYTVDIARGPLLARPMAFVVLDDPVAVAEVRTLEGGAGGHPPMDEPQFLQKLGLVARIAAHTAGLDGPRPLSRYLAEDAAARVGAVAAEVAAVALARGWPAVLKHALGVVASAGPAAAGLAAVGRAAGSSALAAAAAAGSPAGIDALGEWAAAHGAALVPPGVAWDDAFLLAALLRDPVPVAEALARWVPGAESAWAARAPSGLSALALAGALGQAALLRHLADAGVPGAGGVLMAVAKGGEVELCGEIVRVGSGAGGEEPAAAALSAAAASKAVPAAPEHDAADAGPSTSAPPSPVAARSGEGGDEPSAVPAAPHPPALLPLAALAALRRRGSPMQRVPQWAAVLYQIFLTVVLPAVLPERMALGAALLPAVATASCAGGGGGSSFIARTMLRTTLQAVLAVALNRSAAMGAARASAFSALCASPAARTLVTAAWMWAMACHLCLGPLQHGVLFLVNFGLSLVPLPEAAGGREAWVRMTGAAAAALTLTVCVPLAVVRLLKLAGYPAERRGGGRRGRGAAGARAFALPAPAAAAAQQAKAKAQ